MSLWGRFERSPGCSPPKRSSPQPSNDSGFGFRVTGFELTRNSKLETRNGFVPFSPLKNLVSHTLPNGLRVLFKEDHAWPLLSIHGWAHVGSVDEQASQAG